VFPDITPPIIVFEAIVDADNPSLKILTPEKYCAPVVTNPLADNEAFGILKVCVLPVLYILKSAPEVPTAKFCDGTVRPLSVVIPPPENGGDQLVLPRASVMRT
jgi:hypothetical protein